jgi:ectoine hydroxylase-related dioxygenase (phytanoyl-CoA dioxygenase family)
VSFVEQLRSEGYAIVENILDDVSVRRYIDLFSNEVSDGMRRGGRRNLLAIPEMRELAESKTVMRLVQPSLGNEAFVVRGILFDKQDGANWKVPWHQDVTIAVKSRAEADGYGPWSIKEGVQHVQPPGAVLERMVSVRLHLDDCPVSNGALRVIARSHLLGKLDQNRVPDFVSIEQEVVCEVGRGGALLMSPLTIHASSVAEKPQHRRVIHFDYSNVELSGGLEWFEAISFTQRHAALEA